MEEKQVQIINNAVQNTVKTVKNASDQNPYNFLVSGDGGAYNVSDIIVNLAQQLLSETNPRNIRAIKEKIEALSILKKMNDDVMEKSTIQNQLEIDKLIALREAELEKDRMSLLTNEEDEDVIIGIERIGDEEFVGGDDANTSRSE